MPCSSSRHRHQSVSILLVLAMGATLPGCQLAPAPRPEPSTPAALAPLPELPVAEAEHFTVDAAASDVRMLVYRGGPLARYGHHHAIRAVHVTGDIYLAPDFHDSGFSLSVPVRDVIVDPPDARADEGAEFAIAPSAQAVEATLKNLLGPDVLDAEHFPEITIRSVALIGPRWGPEATVRISLHGVARDITVPIAIEHRGDELITTGLLVIRTSDFGITPFSVLGGGLQVQDEIKVRFRLVAHKG